MRTRRARQPPKRHRHTPHISPRRPCCRCALRVILSHTGRESPGSHRPLFFPYASLAHFWLASVRPVRAQDTHERSVCTHSLRCGGSALAFTELETEQRVGKVRRWRPTGVRRDKQEKARWRHKGDSQATKRSEKRKIWHKTSIILGLSELFQLILRRLALSTR